MSQSELLVYKDALAQKKFTPDLNHIERISSKGSIPDYDRDTYGNVIDPFYIDQNKIEKSKSYRRESQKTQVIYLPNNPHIRTRFSHTSEVDANAFLISEILGLNTNLCRAIAFGHDIGHGPNGHLFEKIASKNGVEFKHNIFSAIVAIYIEKEGAGLNLVRQTNEGIVSHSQSCSKKFNFPSAEEYKVVLYSDKISYLFADINDLVRLNMFDKKDLNLINSYFPGNQTERSGECIKALIEESAQKGFVSFEDSKLAQDFKEVRSLLFKKYYSKLDYDHLKDNLKIALDSVSSIKGLANYDPILIVALMTDSEVLELTNNVKQKKFGRVNLSNIRDFGVTEIIKKDFLEGQTYLKLEQDLKLRLNR